PEPGGRGGGRRTQPAPPARGDPGAGRGAGHGSIQRQGQRGDGLMPSIPVHDLQGEVLGDRVLPDELFGVGANIPLMHQVVVAGAAAQRAGTHSTKTRGDVSGGGVKPWRQKGTGRARQGSIRAPHWMGGGVAHGPQPRSHAMRVNKKMKRAALRSALSDAAASGKLALVQDLAFEEPRTRDAAGV